MALVWSYSKQRYFHFLTHINFVLDVTTAVVDDFGFTLDQVNWFSNIVNVTYLPVSILVPMSVSRYGIQRSVRPKPLSSHSLHRMVTPNSVKLALYFFSSPLGYDTLQQPP